MGVWTMMNLSEMTARDVFWHNYRLTRKAMKEADDDGRRAIRTVHKVGIIVYPVLLIALSMNGDEWATRQLSAFKETLH